MPQKTAALYFILPFVFLITFSFLASPQIDKMSMHKGHKGGGDPMAASGGIALGFEVPSGVVMGGFGCLYNQVCCRCYCRCCCRYFRSCPRCCSSTSPASRGFNARMAGAPQGASAGPQKPHRRQLGIGVGCYDIGAVLRPFFYFLAYFAVKGWLSIIPTKRTPVLTNAGAFSLYGYLLHPFVIWYLPWAQEAGETQCIAVPFLPAGSPCALCLLTAPAVCTVHIAATAVGGQGVPSEVSNVGGVLVVFLFVVVVWLTLSSLPARYAAMMCTEPRVECLFIDPEAPTPALNKGESFLSLCPPPSWCRRRRRLAPPLAPLTLLLFPLLTALSTPTACSLSPSSQALPGRPSVRPMCSAAIAVAATSSATFSATAAKSQPPSEL